MNEIDKLKKRFLDGEISAIEYEEKLLVVKNKQIAKTVEIKNNPKADNSHVGVIVIIIVISLFVIYFTASQSKPKEEKVLSSIAPIKSKEQIAKDDSLYKIELEKRRKEEIAEEAAFMKTKAGRIYKKHPEWSREDCERLANNKIWIGMTIDMLKYSNGRPTSANPSNYGNGVTQWQWCWSDFTPSCYYDNDGDGKIDSYN